MSNPLHAAWYADQAVQRRTTIVAHEQIARDTFRLRFRCPELAAACGPGQFLMLRLADYDDPLIGRPLALFETHDDNDGQPADVDVVYVVKGKFTQRLRHFRAGQSLIVWGPLGNGFIASGKKQLVLVAGGIGQTPMLAVMRHALGQRRYGPVPPPDPAVERVTFCYGARSADYFAGLDDFTRAGADLRLSTDDGSRGRHGLVTDVLREVLDEQAGRDTEIFCCGPEPMMEAVAAVARRAEIPCFVSLETPMACGIGICFTCVARVREEGDTWDYKRTCVEGPVFDAAKIVW